MEKHLRREKRGSRKGSTAKPPTAKPPCRSCKNLDDSAFDAPSDKGITIFHANLGLADWVFDLYSSPCPICRVFLTAARIFSRKTDLFIDDCEFGVVLFTSPKQPLRIIYEEERYLKNGTFDLDFITTSALAEPFTKFKPTPLMAKHSDEPQCFVQIRDWMTVCDASHDDCKGPVSVRLPTRVIDINPTVDGLRPVLVNANGALGQYAALSYSWGAGLPLKLTRSSLASFKSGIPWTDIPKTLQDAMTITHKLGLRYLWIDALTIIQDDEDDWRAEAARMAMVYGNAHVTIAATHSKDLDAGIFAPRDILTRYYRVWPLPERLTPKPTPVEELRDGEIYVRNSPRDTPGTSLDSHPLDKRGWALQEHILSRRVIQYTANQLVWHCRTHRATETWTIPTMTRSNNWYLLNPAVLPPRSEIDATTRFHLSAYWRRVVLDYSARKLTRESDKLVAISGVADALSASGMGPHHAGVFKSDLLVGLAWHSCEVLPDGPWAPTHVRPARYRAPSWSWASLDGKVRWERIESISKEEHHVYLRPPFAQCVVVHVSDTTLVLRGKQIPGVLTRNTSIQPTEDHDEKGYSMSSGSIRIWTNYSGYHTESPHTDIIDTTPMHPGVAPPAGLRKVPLDVICLLIGSKTALHGEFFHYGAVLILTRSSTDARAYERVGIDFDFDAKHFNGVEETEVTIV